MGFSRFQYKLLFYTSTLLFTLSSGIAKADLILDKQAFVRAFQTVFQQRGTFFDSLKCAKEGWDNKALVALPAATSCIIKNGEYVAEYDFKLDKQGALAFREELKELLGLYAAQVNAFVAFTSQYGGKMHLIYFSDSSLFSTEESFIKLMEEEPSSDYFEKPPTKYKVQLTLRPKIEYAYYSNNGAYFNDPSVSNYLQQIAFGQDTAMLGIRTNKRTQGDETTYQSKLSIEGFSTTISYVQLSDEYLVTIDAKKIFKTDQKSFLKEAELMTLKLNTAMPKDYCYAVNNAYHFVQFKSVPFRTSVSNQPTIRIYYSAVEGKANEFTLLLRIERNFSQIKP